MSLPFQNQKQSFVSNLCQYRIIRLSPYIIFLTLSCLLLLYVHNHNTNFLINGKILSKSILNYAINNNTSTYNDIKTLKFDDSPSLKYTNLDWFRKGYNQTNDFVQLQDYNQCPSCNFESRSLRSNSSPQDAILITMLNCTYNLVPFTRSLRTTGSKALVVIFIDDLAKQKIDTSLSTFAANCGITFIYIGKTNFTRNELLLFRNPLLFDFLKLRPNLFKRILIVDLFDSIFQGDPFYEDFDTTTVGFSVETHRCDVGQIRNAGYLVGKKQAKVFFNHSCVNIGTIVGCYEHVVMFLYHYVNYLKNIPEEKMKKLYWIPDQVILNTMINLNITDELGIKIHLYKNDEPYAVLMNLFKTKGVPFDVGYFKPYENSMYPFVVHLFDRSRRFCKSVLDRCPQIFPTNDSYIRCSGEYK